MASKIHNELAADSREIERWIGKSILSRVAMQHVDDVRTSLRILALTRNSPQHSAAAFQPLWICIERECANIIKTLLDPHTPAHALDRRAFYDPPLNGFGEKASKYLREKARRLKRLMEAGSTSSAPNLLFFCLEIAQGPAGGLCGIFLAIHREFSFLSSSALDDRLRSARSFRNSYVAHGEYRIVDLGNAIKICRDWISLLNALSRVNSSWAFEIARENRPVAMQYGAPSEARSQGCRT